MSTETAEATATTETTKPVEEQVPLAERYKAIHEKRAKERAQPEPEAPKEESKPDKETAKPKDERAEVKSDAKTEKPKTALDAVLSEPKPDAKDKTEEASEIPANAPAKMLREAMERHRAEAIKWKAEAEKAKGGDPLTKQELATLKADREKLAAENAQLRDSITVINVEYDPAVQEKYVAGEARLLDQTVKDVEKYGGDAKAFAEAMNLPEGKPRTLALKEALENVDEMDRPIIHANLTKIRELRQEHADLVANSQQSYEKLTKARQERALQQHEQTEQQKRTIAERVLGTLSSKHPLFLESPADAEGATDYNARLKTDMEKAAHLRGPEAQWDEISEASAKAARYDFLEETHLEYRDQAQAEIAELKERLAKFEGADTGFTGGKKPGAQDPSTLTPGQRYLQGMARRREAASA